jgi:hypothetical protein
MKTEMKEKKSDKLRRREECDFEQSLQRKIEKRFHKKVVIDYRISESAKQI